MFSKYFCSRRTPHSLIETQLTSRSAQRDRIPKHPNHRVFSCIKGPHAPVIFITAFFFVVNVGMIRLMWDMKLKDRYIWPYCYPGLFTFTILASLTRKSIVSNQANFRGLDGLSLKLLNSLHDFFMHGHYKKTRAIKDEQPCGRCKPQEWRYIWLPVRYILFELAVLL